METIELMQRSLSPYLRTTDGDGFICGESTRYIFGILYNKTNHSKFFTLKVTEKNPKKKGWRKARVNFLQQSSGFDPCETSGSFTVGKTTIVENIWMKFYNFCLPFDGKTVWVKIEEKKVDI